MQEHPPRRRCRGSGSGITPQQPSGIGILCQGGRGKTQWFGELPGFMGLWVRVLGSKEEFGFGHGYILGTCNIFVCVVKE